MPIFYILTKSNMKGKSEGLYYTKAVTMGEMHTMDLACIINANNSADVADVQTVLTALTEETEVMEQYLGNGQNNVLDGFGRFRLSLECESVKNPQEFSVKKHVKTVHCNFIPEGKVQKKGVRQEKIFCSGVNIKETPKNNVKK